MNLTRKKQQQQQKILTELFDYQFFYHDLIFVIHMVVL